ncbi:MAG: ATP-binding protein [Bacteroidia bacterium]
MEGQVMNLVRSYINQSLAGLKKENNNFDFKRKWYDLSMTNGIYEFLKDVSAMANTIGGDSYIVIGYDEDKNKFYPTRFEDSKLNDVNELMGIIAKHIDRAFIIDHFEIEYENNPLSVIYIPNSHDKPHVIRMHIQEDSNGNKKTFEQRIYLRNSTGTKLASRADLDLIYHDRKGFIIEYSVAVGLTNINFGQNYSELWMNIENVGQRTIAICKVEFSVSVNENLHVFSSAESYTQNNTNYHIRHQPIRIPPNDIRSFSLRFTISKDDNQYIHHDFNALQKDRLNVAFDTFAITMMNGKKLHVSPEIIG